MRWLAIGLASFVVFVSARSIFLTVAVEIKRGDTATQTIRSASQGKIELVGRVAAIGRPLRSPLYSVPCVAYDALFDASVDIQAPGPRSDDLRPVKMKAADSRSFLLTDGANGVFVPYADEMLIQAGELLESKGEPLDSLGKPARAKIAGRPIQVLLRSERVLPVGQHIQVNGVLRSLRTADSYAQERARHLGRPAPSAKALDDDPVERDWRAYCRSVERRVGRRPARVDAMLPLSRRKGVPVTRFVHSSRGEAARHIAITLLYMLPALYVGLSWLGWLPGVLPPPIILLEWLIRAIEWPLAGG